MATNAISPYVSSAALAATYPPSPRAQAAQVPGMASNAQPAQPLPSQAGSGPVGKAQTRMAAPQPNPSERVTLSNQARQMASQAADQSARQTGAPGRRGDEAMSNPTAAKAVRAYMSVSGM